MKLRFIFCRARERSEACGELCAGASVRPFAVATIIQNAKGILCKEKSGVWGVPLRKPSFFICSMGALETVRTRPNRKPLFLCIKSTFCLIVVGGHSERVSASRIK